MTQINVFFQREMVNHPLLELLKRREELQLDEKQKINRSNHAN